jgi:hypothetical protein
VDTYTDPLNAKWSAAVVDVCREPLDGKCLYHPVCGNFFNQNSLCNLFDTDPTTNIESLAMHDKSCHFCVKPMSEAKVCYPHSAEPTEKQAFEDLKALGFYGVDFASDRIRNSRRGSSLNPPVTNLKKKGRKAILPPPPPPQPPKICVH